MKNILVLGLFLFMVAILGCEKKTVIETPAGKISVTQPR